MARVNVYLPDELAEAARAAGLNVSSLTQDALSRELARRRAFEWVQRIRRMAPTGASHDEVMEAVGAAREEFGA